MSLSPFTLRVIEIVRAIPRGKVMTYGLVAEQAGNRRAARQVVRIRITNPQARSALASDRQCAGRNCAQG